MTSFFNRSANPNSFRLEPRYFALPLLFNCLLSISCGGGNSVAPTPTPTPPPPTVISVSVSPNPAFVQAGASQPFTAAVSNSTDQSVTWSLSGAGCSNATCGTLSAVTASSVTYGAPSPAPT